MKLENLTNIILDLSCGELGTNQRVIHITTSIENIHTIFNEMNDKSYVYRPVFDGVTPLQLYNAYNPESCIIGPNGVLLKFISDDKMVNTIILENKIKEHLVQIKFKDL